MFFRFLFVFLYSRTWKLQNKGDCASPAKVFTKKKLDINAQNCLICGQKTARKAYESRKKREKSLKLRNECNSYNISYFLPFIYFKNNIWISETDSVR